MLDRWAQGGLHGRFCCCQGRFESRAIYFSTQTGLLTKLSQLNVSGFGQDLIDTGSDDANTNQDEDGGFLDDIGDAFNDVKDSVLDEVNDLVGDMTNEVADKLGLADWYSLHIMDRCEGDWKPSHDADNAKLNVTYCSDPEPGCKYQVGLRIQFT